MSCAMRCLKDQCRSPTACGSFGYCRERNMLVSEATREHERRAVRSDTYRVSWQTWRSVARQRIGNLAFLTASHWRAVY